MTLLAIVLSLFIERVWTTLAELRSFAWFDRLVDRFAGKGPAVVAAHVLFAKIFAVLGLVFAVLVVLFCLGPRDLDSDVHGFLNAWEQGDEDKAQRYARRIFGETAETVEMQALGRPVVEGIVVAAHERWFGVIFWFVILGPLGAVWYRLACVLREKCLRQAEEDAFKDAALLMHHILAWIPVRLTLLSYALTGSFGDTLEALRKEDYGWKSDWLVNNLLLLIHGGLGALQLEQELAADETRVVGASHVRASLGLVLRTLILAIVFIAVLTLGNWVS